MQNHTPLVLDRPFFHDRLSDDPVSSEIYPFLKSRDTDQDKTIEQAIGMAPGEFVDYDKKVTRRINDQITDPLSQLRTYLGARQRGGQATNIVRRLNVEDPNIHIDKGR